MFLSTANYLRRFAVRQLSSSAEVYIAPSIPPNAIIHEEKRMQSEDDDAVCNISRLPTHLLEERANYIPQTIDEKRRYFGKLGLSSNVDPSLLWPTRDEFIELKQFQDQFEPKSLQTLLTELRLEQEETAKAEREREEKVVKAMSTMKDVIAKFHAKRARRAGEISKMDEKRQALLDEAREYFGYELSPRDPRFLELVERKQEEEKRLKKKMRKEKKVERAVWTLTGGQVGAPPSEKEGKSSAETEKTKDAQQD